MKKNLLNKQTEELLSFMEERELDPAIAKDYMEALADRSTIFKENHPNISEVESQELSLFTVKMVNKGLSEGGNIAIIKPNDGESVALNRIRFETDEDSI